MLRGDGVAVVALIVWAGTELPARAQAWTPPAGIGSVNFVYQDIDNTGHRDVDGNMVEGYDSASRTVLVTFDYAPTDRFSFTIGVPYVAAKYVGPLPSFFALPIDDCHCWNHGWQDFGATFRYNLIKGTFALTPSVSVGVPSHGYQDLGEATLGRNLNEVRFGIDAGQRLDRLSPRLSVTGSYSFAFVEKVIDLPNNRSNMSAEVAFLATRKLFLRSVFSWQVSHGGLQSNEFDTEEEALQFDRIIRDNSFHVGGGVSYSLPAIDVFLAYTHYVSGTDTHAGRAISTGISWPFEWRLRP
jgi:hypothetical protein